MFSLSTDLGNTLDLDDCIQNSLETETPFISFYSQKQEYHVSYYFDDKSISAYYYGENEAMEKLVFMYWEGLDIAGQRISSALEHQEPAKEYHLMSADYIPEATAVILHVMDEFSKLAEKLVAA